MFEKVQRGGIKRRKRACSLLKEEAAVARHVYTGPPLHRR